MKTFYIPVHFYERDEEDDLVMFVTKREIEDSELKELLNKQTYRHADRQREYDSREDMVDAIFDALAKEVGGIWSYCKTLAPLEIVEYPEEDMAPKEIKATTAEELARLLIELEDGETLDFYGTYDEETGNTADVYGAAMVNHFESFVILINYYGGGVPYVIDVTEYHSDLKRLTESLLEYFDNIGLKSEHAYINESLL